MPAAGEPDWPLLALDGRERPHLVYSECDEGERATRIYRQVRNARWAQPEFLHADRGEPTQFALDAHGTLHVAYRVWYDEDVDADGDDVLEWEDLWYVTDGGGSTTPHRLVRAVMDMFGPGVSAALAIDSADRPHILFTAMTFEDEDYLPRLWYTYRAVIALRGTAGDRAPYHRIASSEHRPATHV